MALASVEQPVHPRQQIAGTVVGVQDDGHPVCFGQGAHVMRPSHRTEHGRLLICQRQRLASVEFCPSVGELNDDSRLDGLGSLQDCIDAVAANHVDRWKSVAVLFGMGPNV